ncbi:MAG: hypothetical protein IJC18_04215 [Clostridia bacterium]|nr:hypothetical protein [Clostridia bacterium]
MAEKKKERVFVSAKTGEKTNAPAAKKPASTQKSGGTKKPATSQKSGSAKKPVIDPAAKKRATGLRIGAVVLWVAAIIFEVLCILLLSGTLYIPGNAMTYLIIGIVADLVCVFIGSQLWKNANDIDPASEKNKVKFFLWNQMGVIAAVIAFFPLLILLLKDKDLDAKTKKILSIIAAVAMLIAVGTSIDYNPTSAEDLAAAQADSVTLGDGTAYWTRWGKSYHLNPDCQAIINSEVVYQGTIEEAFDANRNDPCDFCAIAEGTDILQKELVSGSDLTASGSDVSMTDLAA